MLHLYRRHLEECDPTKRVYGIDCECPLWMSGTYQDRRIRKSLRTTNRSEADLRMRRFAAGCTEKLAFKTSVQEAVLQYLKDCESRKLSENTMRSYISTLHQLADIKKYINEVTQHDIVEYLTRRKVSAASVRKELQHLRGFLSWCVDKGYAAFNLAAKLKGPRVDTKPTMPFTHEEIARLIAACDHLKEGETEYGRALIYTLLYTGLRISDITSMTVSEINAGKLRVKMMKTGDYVTITLPQILLDSLDYIKPAIGKRYFWSQGYLSSGIEANRRLVARIGQLAKVDNTHPHRFRDTFAVELLLNGEDIRTVQLLLGHASVTTTERHYAPFIKAMQQRLDSATAKLNFG